MEWSSWWFHCVSRHCVSHVCRELHYVAKDDNERRQDVSVAQPRFKSPFMKIILGEIMDNLEQIKKEVSTKE